MANTGDNIYRRKDKRWEGRFISGRKANGQAKYTYVYGKTRTETKEKLEKRKLMVAAQPTGSCRMTVSGCAGGPGFACRGRTLRGLQLRVDELCGRVCIQAAHRQKHL